MKFSLVILAATASASLVARDATPYKQIVDSITSNITSLDTAVNNYTGDKKAVVDASTILNNAIKSGKSAIDGLDPLSALDATQLTSPIQSLNTESQKLVNDLKKKRDTIQKSGECGTVRQFITDFNTNSQALVKAAVSKVPKGFQTLADGLVSQFTKSLDDVQDYFSTTNCKESGTPAPSSSGPSKPSDTTPTGTAQQPSGTGQATSTPTPTGKSSAASTGSMGGLAVVLMVLAL